MAVSRVIPRWFPLPFLILGAYIVLLSLGLLPYAPSHKRPAVFDSPQHWQITSIGIGFFCAGISLAIANRGRWLPAVVGTVVMVALVTPMVWFFYFSGVVELPIRFFASIPLVAGLAGTIFGLVRTAQGKSPIAGIARDPAGDADTLLAYGRTAQARALLRDAMKRDPSRAAEFQRKLEKIDRDT